MASALPRRQNHSRGKLALRTNDTVPRHPAPSHPAPEAFDSGTSQESLRTARGAADTSEISPESLTNSTAPAPNSASVASAITDGAVSLSQQGLDNGTISTIATGVGGVATTLLTGGAAFYYAKKKSRAEEDASRRQIELNTLDRQRVEQEARLQQRETALREREVAAGVKQAEVERHEAAVERQKAEVKKREIVVEEWQVRIAKKEAEVKRQRAEDKTQYPVRISDLERREAEVGRREAAVEELKAEIKEQKAGVERQRTEYKYPLRISDLERREAEAKRQEAAVEEHKAEIERQRAKTEGWRHKAEAWATDIKRREVEVKLRESEVEKWKSEVEGLEIAGWGQEVAVRGREAAGEGEETTTKFSQASLARKAAEQSRREARIEKWQMVVRERERKVTECELALDNRQHELQRQHDLQINNDVQAEHDHDTTGQPAQEASQNRTKGTFRSDDDNNDSDFKPDHEQTTTVPQKRARDSPTRDGESTSKKGKVRRQREPTDAQEKSKPYYLQRPQKGEKRVRDQEKCLCGLVMKERLLHHEGGHSSTESSTTEDSAQNHAQEAAEVETRQPGCHSESVESQPRQQECEESEQRRNEGAGEMHEQYSDFQIFDDMLAQKKLDREVKKSGFEPDWLQDSMLDVDEVLKSQEVESFDMGVEG